MEFELMKILILGAAIGFFQSALSMLKEEDWGKLDFCEYLLLLLKQIHVLTFCLLCHVVISAAFFTVIYSFSYTHLLLNSTEPQIRYALLLLAGYLPSKTLFWLAFVKRLRKPLSEVDLIILRWREIFIEQLRTELKLRLIQLHCRLQPRGAVLEEKLYLFFENHKTQIARDLNFKKALKVHPKDYALMTRCLMEWQGYHAAAGLFAKKGFLSSWRRVLCPLGTMSLVALSLYLLYRLGFFSI